MERYRLGPAAGEALNGWLCVPLWREGVRVCVQVVDGPQAGSTHHVAPEALLPGVSGRRWDVLGPHDDGRALRFHDRRGRWPLEVYQVHDPRRPHRALVVFAADALTARELAHPVLGAGTAASRLRVKCWGDNAAFVRMADRALLEDRVPHVAPEALKLREAYPPVATDRMAGQGQRAAALAGVRT